MMLFYDFFVKNFKCFHIYFLKNSNIKHTITNNLNFSETKLGGCMLCKHYCEHACEKPNHFWSDLQYNIYVALKSCKAF